MKISTKGRYALRLMIDVAQHDENGNVSIKDISARQEISIKYLEQIVSTLCKIGYLKSTRGAQGGYRLTKNPAEYTIGDILRVTEGPLSPIACLDDEPNQCPRCEECVTLDFWKGLYKVINEYVDSVSLADLLESIQDKGAYEFYI